MGFFALDLDQFNLIKSWDYRIEEAEVYLALMKGTDQYDQAGRRSVALLWLSAATPPRSSGGKSDTIRFEPVDGARGIIHTAEPY